MYVTAEDISEVRAGKHNAFPWESRRCAWCASCHGKLTGERLGVVITGVQGMRFLHLTSQECDAVITQRRATAKPITVKVPKPYVPKTAGWVLTPEELMIAEFTPDRRLPRKITQCRICGEEIVSGQDRSVVKVKDDRGWNAREGFVHANCVTNTSRPIHPRSEGVMGVGQQGGRQEPRASDLTSNL